MVDFSTMTLSLPNPPIAEAIISFDCELPDTVVFEEKINSSDINDRLIGTYPLKRPLFFQESNIDNTEGGGNVSINFKGGLLGIQYISNDEKRYFQVRRTGVSLNCLPPYSSLDDYLNPFWEGWCVFRDAFEPLRIKQIGLRYINRFMIPKKDEEIDLKEYFKVVTMTADPVRLVSEHFLNHYTAQDRETGYHVKVTLTPDLTVSNGLGFLFDNWVYASEPSLVSISYEEYLELMQRLRELKNHVFQETLEEKCLQLFL